MTGQYVFEKVMHLHDDGEESTGRYDINDNKEYKNRMVPLINLLLSELYPFSDTCVRKPGKRPYIEPISSLDDDIDLDMYCLDTLCYGVAARMFTIEDTNSSNFYEQEYERRLNWLKSGGGMPSDSEDIVDVYAGGYYDGDGEWHYFPGNGIGFEWVARWV